MRMRWQMGTIPQAVSISLMKIIKQYEGSYAHGVYFSNFDIFEYI